MATALADSPVFSRPRGGRKAPSRTAVTVLCGGPSSERDISLISGRAVAAGLRSVGYDVLEADISADDLSALQRPDLDAVFVALHGRFGEDGQVQALLEARGIPYTGSGPEACRLSLDKQLAKDVFDSHGIPVPAGRVVRSIKPSTVKDLEEQLGLPLVTKPVGGGSSIMVNIARTGADLLQGLKVILDNGETALVEQFIPGREFTVGVLEGRALPIIELRTPREFYDYVAKYQGRTTEYVFETGLPADVTAMLQSLAERAHRALGCRDMSRVDIRLDPDGRPFVLELNAIPGFTEKSLLPKAAARAGIPFPELCRRLVDAALDRC